MKLFKKGGTWIIWEVHEVNQEVNLVRTVKKGVTSEI